MRKNNLEAWTYTSSLNCLLFFGQRMDELLFHHTTDTYRYSALSIGGLAFEYCVVYRDAKAGTINKKIWIILSRNLPVVFRVMILLKKYYLRSI